MYAAYWQNIINTLWAMQMKRFAPFQYMNMYKFPFCYQTPPGGIVFRPPVREQVAPESSSFYPYLQLNTTSQINLPTQENTNTSYNLQPTEFKKASTINEAKQYAINKLHIPVYEMDKDLETANTVNEVLTELKNQYKGNLPMPTGIYSHSKKMSSSVKTKGVYGFYVPQLKYLALVAPQQKLEDTLQELQEKPNNQNIASWYQKAAKNDFSQVGFVNPDFQKEVFKQLKDYRENPEKYSEKAKLNLGLKIRKLTATNQLLNKRPLDVITHIYQKEENKAIIKNGGFKSLAEISKMTQAEQKEEFYKIFENLQSKNGNVYVDVDLMDKKALKHAILHEFGHFMHYTTKLNNSNNSEVKLSKKEQQIAAYVSEYAKADSHEFVAEVYANVLTGTKYPDEVMALYRKFNGPKIT